jgi:hypothetical protein
VTVWKDKLAPFSELPAPEPVNDPPDVTDNRAPSSIVNKSEATIAQDLESDFISRIDLTSPRILFDGT